MAPTTQVTQTSYAHVVHTPGTMGGEVGIGLGVYGAHGDSLMMAGAVLVAAGIIATTISAGRRPN